MCEMHADVCVVHAYVTLRGHCQVLACERFGFSFCPPSQAEAYATRA